MPAEPSIKRSRAMLLLLAALFLLPLVSAFVLYYSDAAGWRPSGRTNRGELIEPPRPLPAVVLLDAADQQLDAQLLRGKWTLAYVGDGACDARCSEALTLMRQTWLALGKESDRVQRVFFVTSGCCNVDYLRNAHAGLITARLDEASDREFLALFPGTGTTPASRAGRIYIIDPLGNLMMSYAREAPPKGLLEDLKKLLKLSRIG
jgi:cytochrome oxidase Cu insertion factor (SCO1/SenC/PrrC family)